MTDLARTTDLRGATPEAIVAAAFLAGHREPTRSHYAMVIRQWFDWCDTHGLRPMEVQRVHLELWLRDMEERQHLKPSTINGKMVAVGQLYRHAVMDGYLPVSPAQWVKRPSVPRQSTTNGLTRPELLAVLELAKQSSPQDHAIVCILGFNGLRVGELCAIRIEDLGRESGYHTIKIVREKSHEAAVIPLAPRTSWAVEQAAWGRTAGPLFMLRNEVPMDRRGVDRIVKRLCKKAGITKRISPHSFRHTFVTLSLDAGAGVREVQNSVGHADPRMVAYYDRAKNSLSKNTTHLVSAYVES
jgi:integrase/recombinase XerD